MAIAWICNELVRPLPDSGRNTQHVAYAKGARVKPDSEHRMRREALQPGLPGMGRSGGGKAEAERRLQDKEREHDGANAIEQRRQQGRSRQPVSGGENNEPQRQEGADRIVGNPAHHALEGLRWRGGDARMPESTRRHVAKPAPEQAVAQRRDAEHTLQEKMPEVQDERRANTDDHRPDDVVCFNAHCRSWREGCGLASAPGRQAGTRSAAGQAPWRGGVLWA